MSGLDTARYWDHRWLYQNARIRAHPDAALLIVSRYSSNDYRHARRTAVCAAGFNTPLWQEAVAAAYPGRTQGNLFEAVA